MSAEIANCRAVVMGLGRFGGGIGVARWLAGQGAEVVVTDRADESLLAESIGKLSGLGIEVRCGRHDPTDLDGADLLVVSPAVDKRKSEFVSLARERGVPITSEMNLFFERCRGRIVGVTGTTGKSTTCAMLHEVLQATHQNPTQSLAATQEEPHAEAQSRREHKTRAKKSSRAEKKTSISSPRSSRETRDFGPWTLDFGLAWLGGNIGQSLLDKLEDIAADDVVVLELSSFQLDDLGVLEKSPPLAVITNCSPRHLDRHGTFAEYLTCKLNICRYQCADDAVLLGSDDQRLLAAVTEVIDRTGARVVIAGDDDELTLKVLGRHNRRNAAVAARAAALLGVPRGSVVKALADFGGLPHRLQFVRRVNGVDYYNDSKGTSVEAVVAALNSFGQPVILIAGGVDRQESWESVLALRGRKFKHAICIGESGPAVASALGGTVVERLDQAMVEVRRLAGGDDVVLFSPGSPSYDQYVNYEARGDAFIRLLEHAELRGT